MGNDLLEPKVDTVSGLSSNREEELHGYADALLKDGQMRRRHWEGMWWESIAAFMGDFWVQWDVHARRLVEPVRGPDHRVRMAINLVQPAVRTELAKLTKNRPIIDSLSRSSDQEDLNATKVADKLLNNYVERKFHMARVRKRMLNWVLCTGIGGILVDWDDSCMGELEVFHNQEGKPVFDPKLIEEYKEQYEQEGVKPEYKKIPMGEMIIKPVSPFQIVWDFSKNHFEEASWCIFSDAMDVDDVYLRWGKHVAPDSKALPDVVQRRLMTRFDLTNKLTDRPPHAQKLTQVHQMWIKPGHPKFPNGLCLVFTKDAILKATDFPYGHGELPIVMMSHIELPTSQHPMSVISQLKGPVLELSKTKSQLIENRNLMANPPWLIPRQLQITKEIQNKPGLRIEYDYMPNVPEPKPVEMPEMPKYVSDMIGELKEDIHEIAGQGETSQGKVPPGARSGVAIAYLQEEDDSRLGPVVAEFEETIEGVAYRQLHLMAEKYTTPRLIPIYKSNGGEPEVFDFIGTMLGGVYGVQCRAGSALPRSKAAKQQFILDLWDRKLEQDPRKVRQMLELSEGEPDEWEVDLDQAERENHELKEGTNPGVEEWYNHPAHHYIHRNFMKSAEFRKLKEEQKQLFEKHDQEHTEAEQHQAAEMAANQAAQQPQGGQGGGETPPPGSSAPAGANGQTQVQGPPSQFTAATSPRTLMEGPGQ